MATRYALVAALALAAAPCGAQDATVTLAPPDGSFEMTGEILGYDGAWWRLDTDYGVLTFDASAVRCIGAACPPPEVRRLAVSGEGPIGRAVLPPLIASHAAARGMDLAVERADADHETWTLRAPDGTVLEVAIRYTTTGEGFADMVAEEADLVLALRPPRGLEAALVADAGLGELTGPARARVLGTDALVPVVSPGREVPPLTLPQLAALFAGELADWQDVGGSAGPVRLHLTAAQGGAAQAFEDLVMAPAALALAPGIVRHADAAALSRAVAADPAALGILPRGEAGEARPVSLRAACGDPLASGAMASRAGDDPLALPVLLYLPARRLPPMARDLAEHLVSPEASGAVARAGLIDGSPARIPLAGQSARLVRAILAAGDDAPLADLQRLMERIEGRDRLTTTFRFEDGAAALDAPSRDRVLRLARRIAEGELEGRSLLLAGFSDAQGPGARNRRLSARRAETVRAAIVGATLALGAKTPPIVADGFGEAAPLVCDGTPWGRRINRRVELWSD